MPPVSKKCLSLSPAWVCILRAGVFTILGIFALFLALVLVHRGLLPIFAWFLPQLENFFYDLAVFGVYRTQNYVSFDLPAPQGIFSRWSDQCDDGYVFLGPNGKSVAKPGPTILDSRGELVWMSNEYDIATNVQVQRYDGEDYLTFWAGHKEGSLGQGNTFMLDSKYNLAHKVRAVGEGLNADLHEFQLTEDGSALITVYNTTTVDLRSMGWGKPKEGWIEDCLFQEIDIATGDLLFQWRARDHFKAEDSYYWNPFAGYTNSVPFDFYHTNSIEKDSKGNFLISSRHFHHVAYINGTSGEPIWILGGGPQFNQFTDLSDGVATGMKWQHHARWISEEENIISIMDNGNAGPLHVDAPYSKGLIIQLDLEHFTAKLLQEFVSIGHARAASQGSLQALPNGNMFVGWGSAAAWSEYDKDGTLLCEYHFAASWSFWWERVKNYRTFKHHGWIGMPDYPPSAKIKNDKVFVSWNGATEVKHWELQGARLDGGNAFEKIKVIDKEKFEEAFDIPRERNFRNFRVAALDGEHQLLRYSEPVQPETSGVSIIGVLLGLFAGVAVVVGVVCLLRIRSRRTNGKLFSWELRRRIFSREYQYSKL